MAPIRRYLRITKYSVLEVRIYLDNPALAQSWLLNPRFDILPRIIQAVRPLVLPKLREENERAKGKSSRKQKGVKDVVHDEEFEVSIFLTEVITRHSLLTKQKQFRDKGSKIRSNSGKMTDWLTTGTSGDPVDLDDDDTAVVIREESEDEGASKQVGQGLGKRRRADSEESLFIHDDEVSEDEGFQVPGGSSQGRVLNEDQAGEDDDKKKLGMKLSYDGFSIYGRVLCLVVKRKGTKSKDSDDTGQLMLETWVSTQAAQEQSIDDD